MVVEGSLGGGLGEEGCGDVEQEVSGQQDGGPERGLHRPPEHHLILPAVSSTAAMARKGAARKTASRPVMRSAPLP